MATNYVDKDALYTEICEWQDACAAAIAEGAEPPRMTNSIGKAILDTANGLGTRWNFNKYSFIDEMVLDGILAATKAIPKFNREHPAKNPFGFINFIVWRAFTTRIKLERDEHEGKMSLMLDETIEAYNTQDVDGDMNVSKSGLIETYSFNGG